MSRDGSFRKDDGDRDGAGRTSVDVALQLGVLAGLLFLTLGLLRPFTDLAIWTAVLAVALNPAYLWLRAKLGERPKAAAVLVTLTALAVLLGPIAMLAVNLVETSTLLASEARAGTLRLPPLPASVASLPLVGPGIASGWELAGHDFASTLEKYAQVLIGASERAARPALHFVEGLATLLGAVILSGFLHTPAPKLAQMSHRASQRLAGPRGAAFVDIAGSTIRNVARGVIGIGVVQATVVGIGLIVADVPAAGILTLAVLVLSIVQLGAWPVVAGILVWVWTTQGGTGAVILTAYLVPAAFIDMPLKPWLLGRQLATPTLVIFAGVIGGLVGYGLVGLFVGPIVLAIAWDLLRFSVFAGAEQHT